MDQTSQQPAQPPNKPAERNILRRAFVNVWRENEFGTWLIVVFVITIIGAGLEFGVSDQETGAYVIGVFAFIGGLMLASILTLFFFLKFVFMCLWLKQNPQSQASGIATSSVAAATVKSVTPELTAVSSEPSKAPPHLPVATNAPPIPSQHQQPKKSDDNTKHLPGIFGAIGAVIGIIVSFSFSTGVEVITMTGKLAAFGWMLGYPVGMLIAVIVRSIRNTPKKPKAVNVVSSTIAPPKEQPISEHQPQPWQDTGTIAPPTEQPLSEHEQLLEVARALDQKAAMKQPKCASENS